MRDIERDFRKSVVYQIYVRSFCDSDGDGLGDLPGVTSKLDYLAALGVDYLWLTPFFPSPQRDNGYDVSDYRGVDPRYGTMGDFDELVARAAERGMGVMLDMVLCHTSTEHEWFQRALAGEERYQRFYFLRDGRGSTGPGDPGEPPTNWASKFGGSAWEWVPSLGKWYLHLHERTQPDLDWSNPEVREELAEVVRFWKGHGVAGFRFDVVNLISKPDAFEDDFEGDGRRFYTDGPRVHEFIKDLVARSGIEGMVTVGEMSSTSLENCVRYSNPSEHELAMTFSFHHLKVDYRDGRKWELAEPDIARLRDLLRAWQEGMQAGGGWNALFWDNHDQPRAVTRFGGRGSEGLRGGTWDLVGKMLALCAHLMQGTPYVYQGDELGLTNPGYDSIDKFRDVESLNYYRIMVEGGKPPAEALRIVNERSRDNGRTPMQWDATPGAGFSAGRPWIDVPANHALINAAAEVGVEGSMFEFYRALIDLRHGCDVISHGSVRFLDAGELAPRVIAYERALGERRVTVLCSFDERGCEVSRAGLDLEGARVLLGNYDEAPSCEAGEAIALRPFEAVAWMRG